MSKAIKFGAALSLILLIMWSSYIDLQRRSNEQKYSGLLREGEASEIYQHLLRHTGSVPIDKEVDGYTALTTGAHSNFGLVKLALKQGANVNHQPKSGLSALGAASMRNHSDIVDYLLSHGASVQSRAPSTGLPFLLATLPGVAGAPPQMLALLGNTPPERQARDRLKTLQLLVIAGANPNQPNDDGTTAVMLASLLGTDSELRLLLEAGGSVNRTDHSGCNSLDYAVLSCNWKRIQFLLARGGRPSQVLLRGQSGTPEKFLEFSSCDEQTRLKLVKKVRSKWFADQPLKN